jgi:hypothetical protein
MTITIFELGYPELLMLGGFLAVGIAIAFLLFYHPKSKNPLEAEMLPEGKHGGAIFFRGKNESIGDKIYSPVGYAGYVIGLHTNYNGTVDLTVEDETEKVVFPLKGLIPGVNYTQVENVNALVGKPTFYCNMDRTNHAFPWDHGPISDHMAAFQQRVIAQANNDAKQEAMETAEYRESVNPPEGALDRKRVETRRMQALIEGLEPR